MEYTKKDLEAKFNLSDNTVYKTLKLCGLNTGKQKYSNEEIENYFIPARNMLDEGKKQKEVAQFFASKNGQALREEFEEELEQDFDAPGFASDQTTHATDAISEVVAATVTDMVERSVQEIAPFIPALVVQTINTQLSSKEIMDAFEQMRSQIKKRKGSGAAFLLHKLQAAQNNHLIPPGKQMPQLPQASKEDSTQGKRI